jgi:enamine deaminase RidA (YjgF/YER057c/UK114 family)
LADRAPAFSSPDDLSRPAGYSHVVSIPAGRLVWTAGQIGWADVVKLTFFVVDVSALETIRAVRNEFVDTARPPTSSLVQVAGLARAELLIEVEAVAWLPENA